LTESQSRELAHLLSAASDLESIAAYAVETEVVEKLKRIYYFAKRVAKTVEVDEVAAVEQAAQRSFATRRVAGARGRVRMPRSVDAGQPRTSPELY
jgi:hypothetical protein